MKRIGILLNAIFVTSILLNGCFIFDVRKDLKAMRTVVGLSGRIESGSSAKIPLTVLLFAETETGKTIRDIKVLDASDHFYFFLVPVGAYYVIAFEDANKNLIYDTGEYFGCYGAPDRIGVPELTPKHGINLQVSRRKGFPEGFASDISTLAINPSFKSVATGKITDLDDEVFSDRYATMGFWQPIKFLQEAGIGIYFLEEYDPKKIPVLFVHGASGSPRNFKALADGMDRDRFQPWFFHYPSGFRLDKMSGALNYFIEHLEGIHCFKRLFVVAHSMGGLVSRSFIVRNIHESKNKYVRLFVTISSPFGGLKLARQGVEKSPLIIPSWHDMASGSDFIQKLFKENLMPKVSYHLLFSHKGDCSLFMDNNDGAVTLRSQLDPRAQADAVRIYGYDEDHVGILSSPAVIEQFREILADAVKKP